MEWWKGLCVLPEIGQKDPLENVDVTRFIELSRVLVDPDEGLKFNLQMELEHRSEKSREGLTVYNYDVDVNFCEIQTLDELVSISSSLPKVEIKTLADYKTWTMKWLRFSFGRYRTYLAIENLDVNLHVGIFDRLAIIEKGITDAKVRKLVSVVMPKPVRKRPRLTKTTVDHLKVDKALAFLTSNFEPGKRKYTKRQLYSYYKCCVRPPFISMKEFEPLLDQVTTLNKADETNFYYTSIVLHPYRRHPESL